MDESAGAPSWRPVFRVVVTLRGALWSGRVPELSLLRVHAHGLLELDGIVRDAIRWEFAEDGRRLEEPVQLQYDYSGLPEPVQLALTAGDAVRGLIARDVGVRVLLRAAKAVLLDAGMTREDISHLLGIAPSDVDQLAALEDDPPSL